MVSVNPALQPAREENRSLYNKDDLNNRIFGSSRFGGEKFQESVAGFSCSRENPNRMNAITTDRSERTNTPLE